MKKRLATHSADLRGASRLAIDGVLGLTHLVESLHHNIAKRPGIFGAGVPGPTQGITGFSYRGVRWVTKLVGGSLDVALATLVPKAGMHRVSPRREAILAAINGVLGDHLADSSNPLALTMNFRRNGRTLALNADALRTVFGEPTGKLLIYLHGLCMNDLQWGPQSALGLGETAATASPSSASLLARDLACTPLYLHYNTGRHISHNGRDFSMLMGELVANWPVPVTEIVIIAHSMGGLVARSACHDATVSTREWLPHLKKLVFLGTPHMGAPLERGGNWVDMILGSSPYTAPFARLGKLRSAGITDMRYSNLQDSDWKGRDRFARSPYRPQLLSLPKGVKCYAIAATTGQRARNVTDRLLGDGLVPIDSALGRHADANRCLALPVTHTWVAYGINHFELLHDRAVYERLRRWLAPRQTKGTVT
ncbi:MAG: alpha/beta hydrolase [Burkholderiaceae bacterium]|nr:alpha/beta hydrolase [Burkholderiaceae bacterium]